MSNFIQRALVTIVAVPILIFVILSGGYFFAGFCTLVSGLICWEICKMLEAKGFSPNFPLVLVANFGIAHFYFWKQTELLYFWIFLIVTLLLTVELFRKKESPFLNVSSSIFAFVYGGMFFNTAILIRDFDGFTDNATGGNFIILIFVGIWVCDTFAYLGGKNFGRTKLFPRISPKKTFEGSGTGFVGSLIWCFVAQQTFLPQLSNLDCIIFAIITGIVSQFGDLVESMLKRDSGVKDSSNIIPGHGGVFDRFDSLTFILPMVWIYLNIEEILAKLTIRLF